MENHSIVSSSGEKVDMYMLIRISLDFFMFFQITKEDVDSFETGRGFPALLPAAWQQYGPSQASHQHSSIKWLLRVPKSPPTTFPLYSTVTPSHQVHLYPSHCCSETSDTAMWYHQIIDNQILHSGGDQTLMTMPDQSALYN